MPHEEKIPQGLRYAIRETVAGESIQFYPLETCRTTPELLLKVISDMERIISLSRLVLQGKNGHSEIREAVATLTVLHKHWSNYAMQKAAEIPEEGLSPELIDTLATYLPEIFTNSQLELAAELLMDQAILDYVLKFPERSRQSGDARSFIGYLYKRVRRD